MQLTLLVLKSVLSLVLILQEQRLSMLSSWINLLDSKCPLEQIIRPSFLNGKKEETGLGDQQKKFNDAKVSTNGKHVKPTRSFIMEEIFGHGLWENKQSKKQVKETTSFFNNLQNARGDFAGLWGPPIKK
ncbi:hypothetical protein F2Q70_00030799 [Brassica cretica]|uniref:Uncharacterized protein n=1 Tax=Brassica cretica TaxID=69181 RepID=A0A8S9FD82_BRACR|nr:hypothetical protein F2Q70_00030799 [Brassica cretica]